MLGHSQSYSKAVIDDKFERFQFKTSSPLTLTARPKHKTLLGSARAGDPALFSRSRLRTLSLPTEANECAQFCMRQ